MGRVAVGLATAAVCVAAFASCAKADTSLGSIGCRVQADAPAHEISLPAVRGERAQTVIGYVTLVSGHQTLVRYRVAGVVMRVDPHLRVKLTVSVSSNPDAGSRSAEGDLRPVFSGEIKPPGPDASLEPVHYECFPPIG
jgi:hypothetical protein